MSFELCRRSVCLASIIGVAVIAQVSPSMVAAQNQRAFRMTTLTLREPHVFLPAFGCFDATTTVNDLIGDQIGGCEKLVSTQPNPEPCELSLNLVAIFDPLTQTPGPGGALNVGIFPSCIRDQGVVDCTGEPPSEVIPTAYTNVAAGGNCLGVIPGTVGPMNMGSYNPPVATTTGPCAVSDTLNLVFELGDNPPITIPLQGAQLAAQYVGDPATSLMSGLARGFLAEDVADDIVLNFPPFLNNATFSSLFKGGTGSCPGNDLDDMNGESGWWFYLAFTANPVEIPEIVVPTPTATAQDEGTPTPTSTQAVDTPTPTHTPPMPEACAGDCDGNGNVPIEEVQTAAGIFLAEIPAAACPAADPDGSGGVLIFELQSVINSFRLGCP